MERAARGERGSRVGHEPEQGKEGEGNGKREEIGWEKEGKSDACKPISFPSISKLRKRHVDTSKATELAIQVARRGHRSQQR